VKLTRSLDQGLEMCTLACSTEYLWRVQLCGYSVEEFRAPVIGADTDHCGGDACDEDARSGK
jgi:hypothetical protein